MSTALTVVRAILPGFISMRVYSLIRPGDQPSLKDTIYEALAYGLINLGLMFWAVILFLTTESTLLQGILAALVLAVAPVFWPFLLDWVLNRLAAFRIIPYRHKTAWDAFFARRQECWLIVHLEDGTRIAGRFSDKSYATLTPNPGHIYLEELWEYDQESGEFGREKVSDGILLTPEDYSFVEIKQIVG